MISKDMYRSIARASAFSQYHHILYDICTHMVGKCVVGCHLCQDGPSVRAIHKQCIYNVLCLLFSCSSHLQHLALPSRPTAQTNATIRTQHYHWAFLKQERTTIYLHATLSWNQQCTGLHVCLHFKLSFLIEPFLKQERTTILATAQQIGLPTNVSTTGLLPV